MKRLHKKGHIATNVLLDDLEQVVSVEIDAFTNPLNERPQLVAALMVQIGEPCKTLLELFYYYSWSMAEIAERMNYNNANVAKTQKSRCVKQLKQMVLR